MKIKAKDFMKAVVMGLIVVVGTPFVAGFIGGLHALLAQELFALNGVSLSAALALGAGISAFVADLVVTKFMN